MALMLLLIKLGIEERGRAGLHASKISPPLCALQVAQPIMLPIPGQRGHYRIGKVGQKGIAVFLNSRGDLTAYDAQGGMLWQVCAWRGACHIRKFDYLFALGSLGCLDVTTTSNHRKGIAWLETEHTIPLHPPLAGGPTVKYQRACSMCC